MTKDLVYAVHHVDHREWSLVSGIGILHVNSSVARIRIWVAKLIAINPLLPEVETSVKKIFIDLITYHTLVIKQYSNEIQLFSRKYSNEIKHVAKTR